MLSTWRAQGGVADLRQARELVSQSVSDQSEATRDAVVLLLDECVTNAVQHGGGRFALTVRRAPRSLRVEVADGSAGLPVPLSPDPGSERGRGLAIVNRLATRWGANPVQDDGKVVWFELVLD
jgi:anti-sigma regulatory factor (Ser/Thr protein kinase)